MNKKRITILLVEDHVIVRKGLKALLEFEKEFVVIGEAENGLEAIALNQQLQPDIIIMDIAIPKLNGIETSYQILKTHPLCKIIVLSAFTDDGYAEKVRVSNIAGYLSKKNAPELLIHGLKKIMKGERVFDPIAQKRLDLAKKIKKHSTRSFAHFTKNERTSPKNT